MLKDRQVMPVLVEDTAQQPQQQRQPTMRELVRRSVKQQDEDFRLALRKQSNAITEQLAETLKSVVKNSGAHATLDKSAKSFVKSADPCIVRMEEMLVQMCHAARLLHSAFVSIATIHTLCANELPTFNACLCLLVDHSLEAPKQGLEARYGVESERESQMIADGIVVPQVASIPRQPQQEAQ